MKTTFPITVLLGALLAAGCSRDTAPVVQDISTHAQGLKITPWPLPVQGGAQPDLVVAPDGRLLLSWIRSIGGRHALQYVAYAGAGRWESAPKTIAVGTTMVASWADTPHIAMTDDGALWAHWLQSSGKPDAYDVWLTTSRDDGMHWAPPVLVNDDGTATEHGFVSLWPLRQDTLGIAWLDGRNMSATAHDHHDKHDAGAMSLRSAGFDAYLRRSDDSELDAMTCECCQTDIAMTGRGALLVYRDRSIGDGKQGEIRDIYSARHDGSRWNTPKPVHADGWKMSGCPVNGPAVDARGDAAVVVWYTAVDDVPTLKLARSADAGDTFAAPITLDTGAAVQGRADVALDADSTWIVWLREDGGGQVLQLARYTPDLTRELQRIVVAKLEGRGRATGLPQLVLRNGTAYVVWTDVIEGAPQLRGVTVTP